MSRCSILLSVNGNQQQKSYAKLRPSSMGALRANSPVGVAVLDSLQHLEQESLQQWGMKAGVGGGG